VTDGPDADRRRLRATFDGVAERYDAVRPRYPAALVDDLVARAGLGPGSRVLEIGPGTGQLTVDLAARGLDVTAVELGPALAGVARRNLAAFPNARVVVGDFEEYDVPEPLDAVVAATAFHWLSPDAQVNRTAAALRPGGALAVVDVSHVAGGTEEFFAVSQDCYLRFDPATPPGFRLPTAGSLPPAQPGLDLSPLFAHVRRSRHTWEVDYPAARFRALLSTYSPTIDLPRERREGLLDCLAVLIDRRFGGVVTKRYLAELTVARRR
jgi:SAM-dependent methyltransferase